MKRPLLRRWVYLLIAVVAGCQQPASKTETLLAEDDTSRTSASTKPAPPTKIGVLLKEVTNPFFAQMEEGARRAERELGVSLLVKSLTHETAATHQVANIEQLIAAKVDALIIVPTASATLIPALKRAQEQGIEVINIDEPLDPELLRENGLEPIPFIGVDNEEGGYLSAKAISRGFTKPAKVAIIKGVESAPSSVQRTQGALRAFAENPHISVVAQVNANWNLNEAYKAAEELFATWGDIGAIFCANDVMALGVVEYLQKHDKKHVLVASYDAIDEAKQAIRAGTLHATIDQQPDQQAHVAVDYALKAVRGVALPPRTMVDVKLITSEAQAAKQPLPE